MICPHCKSHIENNSNFCGYCGKKIKNDSHQEQYQYSKNDSNFLQATHNTQYSYNQMHQNINDEDYIKKYIGNNYDEIIKERLSIFALMLGPLYLLYKKIYSYGFTLIAIIIIILYYNKDIGSITIIAINVFLGFKFNKIYLEHSNKKVEEIKIKNTDKTPAEILEYCQKKGKDNNLLVFTGICLTIITITSVCIYQNKQLLKTTQEKIAIPSIEKIGELEYQIPKNFQKGKYNYNNYAFYSYINNNEYCFIYATLTNKKYSDTLIQDYLKNYKYDKKSTMSEIEYIKIRNINWAHNNITSDNAKEENYITYLNNYLYHFTYHYEKGQQCKKFKEQIISSIKKNIS